MISNRNETLLRQEFKRRYLTEFSHYVGGLMEESAGGSANFLFMVLTFLIGGPFSVPLAALLGIGVSARYAQVNADVKAALTDAASRVERTLESEDKALLPHVEGWLDAHIDDLPAYLDKLDRFEEERRQVKALVEKANRLGLARCPIHRRSCLDETPRRQAVQAAALCRLSAGPALPARQLAFLAARPRAVARHLQGGGRARQNDPTDHGVGKSLRRLRRASGNGKTLFMKSTAPDFPLTVKSVDRMRTWLVQDCLPLWIDRGLRPVERRLSRDSRFPGQS